MDLKATASKSIETRWYIVRQFAHNDDERVESNKTTTLTKKGLEPEAM
jgi:hypothetical protein